MRSRGSAILLLALVLLGGAPRTPGAQDVAPLEPAPLEPAPLGRADVARALDELKADPNLRGERTIRTLRWIRDEPAGSPPELLRWVSEFFRWFAQSARVVMWVAAAIAGALLAAALVRLLRERGERSILASSDSVPTHVRDLDIRPESLPRDIGGTARRLWDAGDHRAALALLYRGLLSKLVHVHGVPVRDSSTEGDCLRHAAAHLASPAHAYARGLVRAWQRFVYAGEPVDTATVHVLCDAFGSALAQTAPREAAPDAAVVVHT